MVCSLAATLLNVGPGIQKVEGAYLPVKPGAERTKPLLGGLMALSLCFTVLSLRAFAVMKFVGFGGSEEGLNSVVSRIPLLAPGWRWYGTAELGGCLGGGGVGWLSGWGGGSWLSDQGRLEIQPSGCFGFWAQLLQKNSIGRKNAIS